MATVSTVDAGKRAVSRRVTVNTDPAEIFAIVADPHRHAELDGSGTVRPTVSGPSRVALGDTFSVGMKQFGLPYKITSKVTDLVDEDNRKVVEWQHPAGHKWRWEMVQSAPGVTEVTETFDYSTSKGPKVLEMLGQPQANAKGITATLEKLAARFG